MTIANYNNKYILKLILIKNLCNCGKIDRKMFSFVLL